MKSTITFFLLIFVISLLSVSKVQAIGLEVDPGKINIQNVPLGKKIAVSELGGKEMKLRIKNKSKATYTYTINILHTFETKAELIKGYIDIPDTSWIMPENKEVMVPAKSTKVVELYLNIPKLEQYYNKKYQAIIEVKSKKNRPEEIFVLACQLQMFFSTCAEEKEE